MVAGRFLETAQYTVSVGDLDASNPAKNKQDQQNDNDQSKAAASIITRSIERAASYSTETAQKSDH